MSKYWRIAGVLIGACTAVTSLVVCFNRLDIKYPSVTLDYPIMMVDRIEKTRVFGGAARPRILVLGDSTVFVTPAPKQAIPDRLHEELNKTMQGAPLVLNLTTYGASIFDYYPLAHRIADLKPAAVIYGFNLASLSKEWRDRMSRRETYGWLRADHIADAIRGPIYYWGVTFDSLLLYKSLVTLGLTEPWLAVRREQARSGSGLDILRQAVHKTAPAMLTGEQEPTPLFANIPRSTLRRDGLARLEHLYSPALYGLASDSPLLAFYERTLAIFEEAGIPVLVYVVPANVEHMRTAGIPSTDGLATTSRSICALAEAHRGACLDLHRELPDPWFADAGGHFSTEPEHDGMRRVAEALAPAVLTILGKGAVPGGGAPTVAAPGAAPARAPQTN